MAWRLPYEGSNGRLTTLGFDELTYDIGALIAPGGRRVDVVELPTATLLGVNAAARAALGVTLAEVRFELASARGAAALGGHHGLGRVSRRCFWGNSAALARGGRFFGGNYGFDRHSAFGQCPPPGSRCAGQSLRHWPLRRWWPVWRLVGAMLWSATRAKGATMILARYFLRRLLGTAAMVSGVFLGMILLLDMVRAIAPPVRTGCRLRGCLAPVAVEHARGVL